MKETKKEKNFIRDEKCVSFKNNWLIGKGSSFSSFSSSSCVCYILSSLLRQLSLLHQDGERLFSANDVLLLLLLLFVRSCQNPAYPSDVREADSRASRLLRASIASSLHAGRSRTRGGVLLWVRVLQFASTSRPARVILVQGLC